MTFKQKERILEKKLLQKKKEKAWRKTSKSRLSDHRLSNEQEREAIAYWSKWVKINPHDHAFYTSCSGAFFKNYVPDWVYYAYIDSHFNDWDYAVKLDNKCFYDVMFPNCEHPDTIAYRINDIWFSGDRRLITSEELAGIISSEPALFVKAAVVSNGGHGVERFAGDGILAKTLEFAENNKCDLVIQRPIVQSPTLSGINRSSVNTIRVLSVLSENGVKIYSMILRMGVGDSFVDNASSGGITVGITEDGALRSVAYDKKGNKFAKHPTSNADFSQITIPNIESVKALVVKAHQMVPHFRMVSWDIALDEHDLPILIEANLKDGELDFHQLNNGPLFADDTEMILNEVFRK